MDNDIEDFDDNELIQEVFYRDLEKEVMEDHITDQDLLKEAKDRKLIKEEENLFKSVLQMTPLDSLIAFGDLMEHEKLNLIKRLVSDYGDDLGLQDELGWL